MKATVLMYHALEEDRSAISVPPDAFRSQMQLLSREGFRVIPMSRLVRSLRTGEALPDKTVVITFDDGFESVYAEAFPVLESLGFPATVYLVADYCGGSNDWPSQPPGVPRLPLMSWPQIKELDGKGIEFGAHTCTHPRLDRTPDWELDREILESKIIIEDRLGHSIDLFSYPYGRCSESSAAVVGRGFSGACTTELAMVGSRSDPLSVERVDAYYLQQPWLFKRVSGNLFSLYLGLRRPARKLASALLRREW